MELLLVFFSFAALGVFVSAKRTKGFYHFPFLLLITTVGFIGLQLLELERSDLGLLNGPLSEYVITVILANLGVYIGFYLNHRGAQPVAVRPLDYNSSTLGLLSLAAAAIAWVAFILLVGMIGGFQRFIAGGAYSIIWEGAAVQYTFVVQFIYVVIPVALAVWLRNKNKFALAAFVLSLALAMIYIFGLNRRLPFALVTVTIFIISGLNLNFKVKGVYVAMGIFVGIFVNNVFPMLRHSDFAEQQTTWTEILKAPEAQMFGSGYSSDVRNGVVVVAGHQDIRDFQLGFGFLAKVFQDLVPSSIVGREFKTNILEKFPSEKEIATRNTGFLINSNEYVTGPAWVYAQFWHLGVIFWILLGYLAGWLWRKADKSKSLPHQAWYVMFTTSGMVAMVFSPGFMVPYLLRALLFLWPAFLLAKQARRRI